MTAFAAQHADLAALAAKSRRRTLTPAAGHDFASNDYLGLAASPELAIAAHAALARGVPLGSGGSRLLRGNHPEHEALEAEAADWLGAEAALFLPTGYTANSAVLATLPQRGDLILADDRIHASMHEGLRLTRADHRLLPHNDAGAFDDALRHWRADGATGQPWIAVESVTSMDGTFAPLADLAAIADRHDAVLIVDEAHATGIFGPAGRGLTATLPNRERIITLHTCGKALGAEGALLVGPAAMRDHLINRARGFIFSTAPSPLIAAVVRDSLRLVAAADDRRTALLARIDRARVLLAPLGAQCHGSPIMPLLLGDDARAMRVAGQLQAAGCDVRGIRPPTVAEGTARLRIVITLNPPDDALCAVAAALEQSLCPA